MESKIPKGRNDGHVFDYSKVSDQIFIGSDLCKAGVCLIHGEEFRALGVTVEINLSAENNELPPKDIESYTWLPVVDGYSPNQMQLEIGTSIIDTAIRGGKKIYVHCKNGHGRSPSLICAYFMRFGGMSLEEAISFIKKKRPEVHIEDTQRMELVEFSKKWSK